MQIHFDRIKTYFYNMNKSDFMKIYLIEHKLILIE